MNGIQLTLSLYLAFCFFVFVYRIASGARYSYRYQICRIILNLIDSLWLPIWWALKYLFSPTGHYVKIKDLTSLLSTISKTCKMDYNWIKIDSYYICVNDIDVEGVTEKSQAVACINNKLYLQPGVNAPYVILDGARVFYHSPDAEPLLIDLNDPNSL